MSIFLFKKKRLLGRLHVLWSCVVGTPIGLPSLMYRLPHCLPAVLYLLVDVITQESHIFAYPLLMVRELPPWGHGRLPRCPFAKGVPAADSCLLWAETVPVLCTKMDLLAPQSVRFWSVLCGVNYGCRVHLSYPIDNSAPFKFPR